MTTTLNSGVSAVVLDQPTMASWIAQSKQPGGANIMDLLKIDAGKSPAEIESEVIEVETNLVDTTDTPVEVQETDQEPEIESLGTRIAMADFLDQFGEGLLSKFGPKTHLCMPVPLKPKAQSTKPELR